MQKNIPKKSAKSRGHLLIIIVIIDNRGLNARWCLMVTYSQISNFTYTNQLQKCLKSENKEIFTNVSHFITILQQIIHMHAVRSLRHSCLLQASIDREQL